MMEKERAGRSFEDPGSVAIGNVTCALLVYAAPPTQTYHESQPIMRHRKNERQAYASTGSEKGSRAENLRG